MTVIRMLRQLGTNPGGLYVVQSEPFLLEFLGIRSCNNAAIDLSVNRQRLSVSDRGIYTCKNEAMGGCESSICRQYRLCPRET